MAAPADRTATAPASTAAPEADALTYARFGAWYDSHRRSVLEPALEAGLEALGATIDDGMSDRDRSRIRNLAGRVKSKRRTWRKIRQSQYAETIRTTDDIPAQINDLVGLRITCTNLRDIETVQAMLDALPDGRGRAAGLWVEMTAERDYVRAPKESGYRGWHVPLGIEINRGGRRVPVICELQVRTLLQDSWGELTHEDTYSKDGELPPLVEVLSKRIADLFATLDDIAEDLRTELDRLDEAAVAEVDEAAPVAAPVDGGGQAADAASMLLDRWHRMDRPIDLASLAWALQTEFGAEVSDDWFGHRSFKRFLTAAVPGGEISTGDQAYLLPPQAPTDPGPETATAGTGQSPAAGVGADTGVGTGAGTAANGRPGRRRIPDEAGRLRAIDRAFPMLETDGWLSIYDGLAEAWRRVGPVAVTPQVLNRLTRSARDRAEAAGSSLSRRHLDYVAKAVMPNHRAGPLDPAEIASRFGALTVQRMVDFRIIEEDDRTTRTGILRWLGAR